MSITVRQASLAAVAATFLTILIGADGTGAAAQAPEHTDASSVEPRRFDAQPVVQTLPEHEAHADASRHDEASSPAASISASSLAQLVAAQSHAGELSRELSCLAGAVYFEAKSESLTGQLAVGRVIIARSKSGRFANSYCGVVYQPSQFSFVRGGTMPGINRASAQWRNAVAIAQIAHAGTWRSPVEGALYFHAARVSPGWRLTRIGRVENHIFYR